MSNITGTLVINITNNNPNDGCYRICYRPVGTQNYTCSTYTCPTCSQGQQSCPCTITLSVTLNNETCSKDYEGYVQACCNPDDGITGITNWTATFVPTSQPCTPVKFQCSKVKVVGFAITDPSSLTGYDPNNPPQICYTDVNNTQVCTAALITNGSVDTATITETGNITIDTPGTCLQTLYVCTHYDVGTASVVIDSISLTQPSLCPVTDGALFAINYTGGVLGGLSVSIIKGGFHYPATGTFNITFQDLLTFGVTTFCGKCTDLVPANCIYTINYTAVTGTIYGFFPILNLYNCNNFVPSGNVTIVTAVSNTLTTNIVPEFTGCGSIDVNKHCPSDGVNFSTIPIKYGDSFEICYDKGLAGISQLLLQGYICKGYTVSAGTNCCYSCLSTTANCSCNNVPGQPQKCPTIQCQTCDNSNGWLFTLQKILCQTTASACVHNGSVITDNNGVVNISTSGNCP